MPAPSYNMHIGTSTYTVNKALIKDIETYLHSNVLRILEYTPEELQYVTKILKSTIIHDSYGQEIYTTIDEHTLNLFRNDTQAITIKYHLEGEGINCFKINLRLSIKAENCYFSIWLDHSNPREKAILIEEGVFSILDQYKT